MKQFSKIFFLYLQIFCWNNLMAQDRQLMLQNNVLFDRSQANLTTNSQNILLNLLDSAKKFPNCEFRLRGSTDLDGTVAFNKKLKADRVRSVKQFLLDKSVSVNQIVVESTLDKIDHQTAQTPSEKAQSRRVSIEIWATPPPKTLADNQKQAAARFNAFQVLFKKSVSPTQNFRIIAGKENVVTGAEGTKIKIPAQAFPNVPKGENIDFVLKENYTYSSMIADNLTTTSGDKMLQTGGMIYTEARWNGQALALQQPIGIQFSSPESKLSDMQTFTGMRNWQNDGLIDWKPEPIGDRVNLLNMPKTATMELTYFTYQDKFQPYFTPAKRYAVLTLQQSLDTGGCAQMLQNYFVGREPNDQTDVQTALLAYLETVHPKGKVVDVETLHRSVFSEMYFFHEAKTIEELRQKDGTKWEELLRERRYFVPYDRTPAEIKEQEAEIAKANERKYKQLMAENKIKEAEDIKRLEEYRKRQQEEARKAAEWQKRESKIDKELNYIQFSTKLGWVNCDRLVETPREKLVNVHFRINMKPMIDAYNRHFLIINTTNTVRPVSRSVNNLMSFGDIPIGAVAKFVSISCQNGKYYYAQHNFTVEKNMEALVPTYIETNPDDIKNRLASLNR